MPADTLPVLEPRNFDTPKFSILKNQKELYES
jgi:hypothetical protein